MIDIAVKDKRYIKVHVRQGLRGRRDVKAGEKRFGMAQLDAKAGAGRFCEGRDVKAGEKRFCEATRRESGQGAFLRAARRKCVAKR